MSEGVGKREHPTAILVDIVMVIRKAAWSFILLGVQVSVMSDLGWGFLAVSGMFVAIVASRIVAWWRFIYGVSGDTFVYTSGLIRQTRREIPLARLQDIGFERGPLLRALGLVSLSIQTSGSAGAEATVTLPTEEAEALRNVLMRAKPAAKLPSKLDSAPLYRVRTRDLLLRGLTDNRAGLLIAGALTAFHEVFELGGEWTRALFEITRSYITAIGIAAGVALGSLAVFMVWALGYVASSIFNLVVFYGLELREEEGTFSRRYGAVTLRQHAIPRKRVQALSVQQTFARRLIGQASIQVRDMGAGADAKEAQRVGSDTFVPAGPLSEMFRLAEVILPGSRASEWRKVSLRHIRRTATRGLLLASPCFAVPFIDGKLWLMAFIPMASTVLFGAAGLLRHRMMRYAFNGQYFVMRDGHLGRQWTYVPLARIQAVQLARTPLDRWHSVASIQVVVGGGFAIQVPNVKFDEAEAFVRAMVCCLPAVQNAEIPRRFAVV